MGDDRDNVVVGQSRFETTSLSFVEKPGNQGGCRTSYSMPRTKSPRFLPSVYSARVQVSDLRMPTSLSGGMAPGASNSISSLVGAFARS